jgi:exodeoxyribonuclease-3
MLEKSGLKIASWNINSVRKRLPLLERLADESQADVICLQETKANVEHFPAEAIAAMGFEHQAVSGFGGYNGVAVLSKRPLTEVNRYPHCDRNDARHISAVIDGIAVHSLYIPAGGDLPCTERNPKFAHKLRFVDAVADHFAGNHGYRDAMVLAGDFNVAPLPSDVWDHVKLSRIVTHTPIEIAALERMKRSLQFIDTLREVVPENDPVFTWWSYRASDWQAANKGRRLDHIWVTQPLKDCIKAVEVLTDIRHWTPPSDHVPVILTLHKLESAAALSHAREPAGSFS